MGLQCDEAEGIQVQPTTVIDVTEKDCTDMQVSALAQLDTTSTESQSMPSGILPAQVSQSRAEVVSPSPKESIPYAVDATPPDDSLFISSPRIFLDICSGVTSPLSAALHKFHCDTMSFDILIRQDYDLLQDHMYERLLRICACGIVAYSAAAPACKEYSRLKLRAGGPKALRTPEHMAGVPGLQSHEL